MSEKIIVPYFFDMHHKFEIETPLRSPEIPFNMCSNYTKQEQKEFDFASENSAKFSFQKLRQSELSKEQISSIQNNLKFSQFYKNKISEGRNCAKQAVKEDLQQFQFSIRNKKLRKRSQEVSPQISEMRHHKKDLIKKFFSKNLEKDKRSKKEIGSLDHKLSILNVELEEMIKFDKINLNSLEREDNNRILRDNVFLNKQQQKDSHSSLFGLNESSVKPLTRFELDANNNKVFIRKKLISNKRKFDQVFNQMGELPKLDKSSFNLPSTKLNQSKKIKKSQIVNQNYWKRGTNRCNEMRPSISQESNSFFSNLIEINLNLTTFLLRIFEKQKVQYISSRSILKFIKDKFNSNNIVKNYDLYSNFVNSNMQFCLGDIQYIYLFFKTSQNLYNNYKDSNQYYINQTTNEVFLRLPQQDSFQNKLQRSPQNTDPETLQLLNQSEIQSQFNTFNMKVPHLVEQNDRKSLSGSSKEEDLEHLAYSFSKKPEEKIVERKLPTKLDKISKLEVISAKKVKKRKSDRKKQKGCKCSKSKCLRLHCICFRDQLLCGPACGCKGCLNNDEHSHLVERIYRATKDINSQAFESRFVSVQVKGKTKKFTKGCTCSKNNCLKNYCECRKNDMACTPLCKCEHCKNDKVYIEPGVANQLLKRSSRKKKKIIIKNKNNNIEITEQVLMNNIRKC